MNEPQEAITSGQKLVNRFTNKEIAKGINNSIIIYKLQGERTIKNYFDNEVLLCNWYSNQTAA